MRNKAINWILLILSFVLIVNITRTFRDLSRQENIIKEAEDRLQEVEAEKEKLQKNLAKVESQEYIEQEARNKLNLGKEGEVVLILPSISLAVTPTLIPVDNSPSWQKWVNIFM